MALPNWTDYETSCGDLPLTWLQMMASTIVGADDLAGANHYRINTIINLSDCDTFTGLPTCATNHIDAERQLVENTFALDDCGFLELKIMHNIDTNWTDYGVCGEMPLSFLEMLARTIILFGDNYFINSIQDYAECSDLTSLLDCTTNQIESERLLVNNVFAVDDCGNPLIKIINNQSTMTDYHTECVDMPESFIELLARCIVLYNGHYYLNVAFVSAYCDDLTSFWTCALNHIEPERALAENVFATDSCGNLALKILSNGGQRS